MKLVLFIGHHKVGSTSLQAFLAVNRARLNDAGILYPVIEEAGAKSTLRSAGHHVIASLRQKPHYERLTVNEREPHNALAFRLIREYRGKSGPVPVHGNVPGSSAMLETIHRQIHRHRPDSLILCSEVFSNFGDISPDLISWVRESFPADSVQIICTLRRIDQYLCSWYGQRLKFGHDLPPLRRKGARLFRKTVHFNYRKLVKAWKNGFPEAEFVLRNYAKVLESGGSVQDFIAHSRLQFPSGLIEYPNINPSIPYCYYELCRKANSTLTRPRAKRAIRLINRLSRSLDIPKNSQIELLGLKNRQWLFENFAPIDTYLGHQADVDSFFPDQEKVLACNPLDELEAASLALPIMANALGRSAVERDILRIIDRLAAGLD